MMEGSVHKINELVKTQQGRTEHEPRPGIIESVRNRDDNTASSSPKNARSQSTLSLTVTPYSRMTQHKSNRTTQTKHLILISSHQLSTRVLSLSNLSRHLCTGLSRVISNIPFLFSILSAFVVVFVVRL